MGKRGSLVGPSDAKLAKAGQPDMVRHIHISGARLAAMFFLCSIKASDKSEAH
jgi:hypothetical protein